MNNKVLIFFLSLFLTTNLLSQSKAEVNARLKTDLQQSTKTFDSIVSVFTEIKTRNMILRRNIDSCYQVILAQYGPVTRMKHRIQEVKNEVNRLGYDSESIASYTTINTYFSNLPTRNYEIELDELQDTGVLQKVMLLESIANTKMKTQNVILSSKISEYENVNQQNTASLFVLMNLNTRLEVMNANAFGDVRIMNKVEVRYNQRYQLLVEKLEELKIEGPKKVNVSSSDVKEANVGFSDEEFQFEMSEPDMKNSPMVYDESAAEFPGGYSELYQYFKNFQVSDSAKTIAKDQILYVECVISETGKPVACRVTRPIPDCEECNAIALKLISEMPDWKPENHNGKNVSSVFYRTLFFN